MISKGLKCLFLAFIFVTAALSAFSQDDDSDKPPVKKSRKGFHMGLGMGAYFANSTTANLYGGYGFDIYGNKNTTFASSAMNQMINIEYGGGQPGYPSGYPDRISPLLNLNRSDWSFDTTDMPSKMKYNIAYMLGVQFNYCFDEKNAVILNVNACQLTISGDFELNINTPIIGSTLPGYTQFQTCPILGQEERLSFQPGFQRMLGDNPQFCFFIEGGPIMTFAKFQKNQIIINGAAGNGNLTIDLLTYYNNIGYVTQAARNMTGIGFGAFAGLGINMDLNQKWTMQFLYNPSYERINLGQNAPLSFQQEIVIRGVYNL